MIELKNICKRYDDGHEILKDVNAVINNGDIVAIIGPSGCGKSTLLNCINLLNPPTSGQIFYDGVDLTAKGTDLRKYRMKMGMVFQSFNLFNNMTILENVMRPQISLLGRSRQEAYDKAILQLQAVGMEDKKFNYPDSLSGGQKQRAAIARTLAMDPEVILMDEPTSALDPTMVGEVEYVIRKLASQGRTMIIVTHEMRLARQISGRIFYVDEKHIYEEGPTEEIFTNPKQERTRQFINRIRSLELIIESEAYDYVEAMSRIEGYGDKLGLPLSMVRKAQLLYEEACLQTLLPALKGNIYIKTQFEYNGNSDVLSMIVYHGGEKILESERNETSRRIIEYLSDTIRLREVILD